MGKINFKSPIGIFDSGLGGLTVVKEIINLLPNENIVYLGDTARVPYGTKSKETIIRYSLENTKFLVTHNIKLLVVACNTSSSYAIPHIKRNFKNLKVVEVITPGAKAAVESTKKNKIGIIGTKATIKSGSYEKIIKKLSKKIKIYARATPLFVPLVEEGWVDKIINSKEDFYTSINHENIIRQVAVEYLSPLKDAGIDVLVLGCTHYPAIKSIIQNVIGLDVKVIDSSKEVAKVVKQVLEDSKLLNLTNSKPQYKFFTTDDSKSFKTIGSLLLERDIKFIKKINIEEF